MYSSDILVMYHIHTFIKAYAWLISLYLFTLNDSTEVLHLLFTLDGTPWRFTLTLYRTSNSYRVFFTGKVVFRVWVLSSLCDEHTGKLLTFFRVVLLMFSKVVSFVVPTLKDRLLFAHLVKLLGEPLCEWRPAKNKDISHHFYRFTCYIILYEKCCSC